MLKVTSIFGLLLVSFLSANAVGKSQKTIKPYCSVVKAGYRLSLTLYNDFVTKGAGNIIFSPYSISSLTAMVMLGTSGATQNELRAFLQYGNCNPDVTKIHMSHRAVREYIEKQSSDVSFVVADRIFPGISFVIKDNYTQKAEYYYGISVQSLDYTSNPETSRNTINKWIESKTNGILKDVMPPGSISSQTEVVLANAIYFKDSWKMQFDPRRNIDMNFYTSEDKSVQTTFMTNRGMYKHASNDVFSLIELPYNGGVAHMLILLPKKRDGLSHLEKSLGNGILHSLNQYGSMKQVVVRIPKFKIEFTKELTETYKDLGVETLFSNADFSPMTDTKGMFISSIRHKAFINVNEEGTEAAAVTSAAATRSLNFDETFICDHPFMFYIVHKETKSILFLGRYVMPE